MLSFPNGFNVIIGIRGKDFPQKIKRLYNYGSNIIAQKEVYDGSFADIELRKLIQELARKGRLSKYI